MSKNEKKTKELGPLLPQAALDYIERTPNLVIIEVTDPEYRFAQGFDGALYIPHTEIVARRSEIPPKKPVILHCREGVAAAEAYNALIGVDTDISELSYIAGEPLIDEYNEWKRASKNS